MSTEIDRISNESALGMSAWRRLALLVAPLIVLWIGVLWAVGGQN